MVIGVDGNEANVDKHVGTSVYTYELLRYWHSIASEGTSFIIYVREKPRPSLPKESAHFRYRIVSGSRFWRDVFFPLYLYMHREIDVLFCPAHYSPRFCPVPTIVALHDAAYTFFPEEFLKKDLYKLTTWTAHAVKQARHLICVSETTKKDIVEIYHVSPDKISVVLNGFRRYDIPSRESQKKTLASFDLKEESYLLYAGTLQPRKNIPTLIRAFKHIRDTHPHLKLVIAGKKGWLYDSIFSTVKELDLHEHVLFTDYVSDHDLSCLYKNAAAFVMPSLYEGFGIPLLEAMYHQTPVVSSSASCLPETGGDACEYFDPRDEYSCASAIIHVLDDAEVRKRLVAAGTKRIARYSFEQAGEQTLQAIQHGMLK